MAYQIMTLNFDFADHRGKMGKSDYRLDTERIWKKKREIENSMKRDRKKSDNNLGKSSTI